ncbi:MAG: cysteine dioxygenase [Planctomycetota bacterium]|jgi:cysteine dioxygenase
MSTEPWAEIFAELDRYREPIPVDALRSRIERLDVSPNDLRPFVQFHPDRYLRNLMVGGPVYHALVLCWRNGQRSPIHDHGSSHCALKVVEGVATETLFDFAPNGMVYAVSSRQLEKGSVSTIEGREIHQVSNLQGGRADLVTLHVYSPPLLLMNQYSLVEPLVSRFFDPINDEFIGGGGI